MPNSNKMLTPAKDKWFAFLYGSKKPYSTKIIAEAVKEVQAMGI